MNKYFSHLWRYVDRGEPGHPSRNGLLLGMKQEPEMIIYEKNRINC